MREEAAHGVSRSEGRHEDQAGGGTGEEFFQFFAAVAEHPEFQGNVAFVGTRAFWRPQEQSPSGQGYHWNTNAETYCLIGDAMGKAMLGMLNSK